MVGSIIQAAQCLPRDPQIGSYQMLGHQVIQLWIQIHQLFVSGFGVIIHKGQQALLSRHITLICTPAEEMLHLVDLAAKFLPVRVRQAQHLRIGDAIHTNGCPVASIQSIVIGTPPGRHGKLQDMHLDIVVDEEGLQATGQDEILTVDLVTFFDDDLPFFKGGGFEMGINVVQLLIGEFGRFGDMIL